MKALLYDFLPRATVIWGALLAYYVIWGRRERPSFQRWFLLGSWLLGFVIPLLPSYQLPQAELLTQPVYRVVGYVTESAGSPPTELATAGWSWDWLLPLVYGAGVLFFSARAQVQKKYVKQCLADGERSVFAGYPVIRSARVTSPFAAAGRIFLPLTAGDVALTHTALIHESAHLRLRHQNDKTLLTISTILLWFHPLSWIYRRLLATAHEYEADAAVVATVPRRVYARQLLHAAQGPGRGMGLFSSPLKQRITMMLRDNTSRRFRPVSLLVLALLLTGLVACNADADLNEPENAPATTDLTAGVRYADAPDVATTMDMLVREIYQEIGYPVAARSVGHTGRYRASLHFDESGHLTRTSVLPFADSDQAAPPSYPELVVIGYGTERETSVGETAMAQKEIVAEIERTLGKLGKFRPAVRNGKPVPGALVFDFVFQLEPEETGMLMPDHTILKPEWFGNSSAPAAWLLVLPKNVGDAIASARLFGETSGRDGKR